MEKAVRFLFIGFSILLCIHPGAPAWSQSQTKFDLPTQSSNPDFRSFPATYPTTMGSVTPTTCNQGQQFFNSANPAGQNLLICISANVWSVVGINQLSSGPSAPSACNVGQLFFLTTSTAGQNLLGCAAQNVWTAMNTVTANGSTSTTGGPSGALSCAVGVCDIVTALVPLKPSANVYTGANDFSGATYLKVVGVSGVPTTGCVSQTDVAKIAVRIDAMAPASSLYICSQTGAGTYSWDPASASSVSTAAVNTPTVHQTKSLPNKGLELPVYGSDGSKLSSHVVQGEISQTSGTSSPVRLNGPAAFRSADAYTCTVDVAYATIQYIAGNSFRVINPAGGVTHYICVGAN